MVRNEHPPLALNRTPSKARSKVTFLASDNPVSCVSTRLPKAVLRQSRVRAASVSGPLQFSVPSASPSVASSRVAFAFVASPSVQSPRIGSPSVASVLRSVASQLRRVASRLPDPSSDTPKSRLLASLSRTKQAAVERMLQRARQRLSRLSPRDREKAAVETPIPRFAYGASSVEGSASSRRSGAPSRNPRVLN